MHILMLSDVYFPRINGVSTSIQSFAHTFLAQGHRVSLIAPDYGQAFDAGFEVYRIPAKPVPFDPEDRFMSLRAINRLLPRLLGEAVDIVHIHTPFVAHYAGIHLARALGVKSVVSYHTFFEAYFEQYLPWLPKSWLRTIARRFSRRQCNQVDGVISPSHQMLQRLREYGVTQQAAVIPTGLPDAVFTRVPNNRFRRRHDIPENAFLLLYVGRVAHEKNIALLFAMFDEVHSRQPDAILLIAGEGPALKHLHEQAGRLEARDQIRFVGYLDRHTELLECYQASDLFVFSSQTETQGLVLLEAMASGLPVVSVASMGSLDVLREGDGCVISPPQPDAFAERVLRLRAEPEQREVLARRGVAFARQWSSDAMAGRMMAFYDQTLRGGLRHVDESDDPDGIFARADAADD